MTIRTAVRDFYNWIIGWVEEDSITHDKTARDYSGRILGRYDSKLKVTRDFYGRIVAQGDTLTGLIYDEESKRRANAQKK
jgi:hypothetical protein